MKLKNIVKSGAAVSGMILAVLMASGSATADQPLTLAQAAGGDFDPAAVYNRSCAACHNSGAAGAPRMGNSEDWSERLDKGFDTLVSSAINGYNNIMPPKGMCMDCTEEQLEAVVQYILDESIEE